MTSFEKLDQSEGGQELINKLDKLVALDKLDSIKELEALRASLEDLGKKIDEKMGRIAEEADSDRVKSEISEIKKEYGEQTIELVTGVYELVQGEGFYTLHDFKELIKEFFEDKTIPLPRGIEAKEIELDYYQSGLSELNVELEAPDGETYDLSLGIECDYDSEYCGGDHDVSIVQIRFSPKKCAQEFGELLGK